ncbi:MAG: TlpA disulfide reductase family protein [Corynebacterium sp.]|nr:TlpA disulfide reductase family protein [Corynebacterium sp.]
MEQEKREKTAPESRQQPAANRYIAVMVLVGVLLSLTVVAGALFLLRSGAGIVPAPTAETSPGVSTATSAGTAAELGVAGNHVDSVPASGNSIPRPACPDGPVAGVGLPCLGAETVPAAGGISEQRRLEDAAADALDEGIAVVNLWAWWCEPCRQELPYLEELAQQHPEWTVVGVHADKDAQRGASLLTELGVDLPSYQDDSNLFAGTHSLPGVIPITVVVKDGKIVGKYIKTFASTAELEEAVRRSIG